jgi:hypothetical protein
LHVVLCHQLLVRVGIDTLPLREHLFEPTGRHMLVAQYVGPTMFAGIGIVRALNRQVR